MARSGKRRKLGRKWSEVKEALQGSSLQVRKFAFSVRGDVLYGQLAASNCDSP